MAAHVYWRVVFLASSGGASSDIWLDEVSFRSAADADLSTGGTPLSGGDYANPAYSPAQAFDKSVGTLGWVSAPGAFPAWIGYQHATPVDVAWVLVTCNNDPGGLTNELPVAGQFRVDFSDDGTTWTPAGPVSFIMAGSFGSGQTARLMSVTPTPRAVSSLAKVIPPGLTLGGVTPRVNRASVRVDLYFGGRYRIVGDVAIQDTPDVPVRRQVRLFDKVTARLVRETWSAPGTGAYSFDYIANGSYFVVTHDYLNFYNGVIADGLLPELMP